MGGVGSGSKPGIHGSNYKDGRWLYRKRVTGERRGGRGEQVVGHKKAPPRDGWGNITGPARPELHKASNLKYVSKSENAKGPTNRTEKNKQKRR